MPGQDVPLEQDALRERDAPPAADSLDELALEPADSRQQDDFQQPDDSRPGALPVLPLVTSQAHDTVRPPTWPLPRHDR